MAKSPIQQNPAGAYVYAIVVDGVVRYIGKGVGRRIFRHLSQTKGFVRRKATGETIALSGFYKKLLTSWENGAKIEEVFLAEGLSHDDAFALEIKTIALAPVGQLWNVLEGGQGITSEDAKRKWSDPQYRKRQEAARADPIVKAKQSAVHKIVQSDPDLCAKRSVSQKAAWKQPEARARKSAAVKAAWEKPTYREKITVARKAQWANPEFRARLQQLRKRQWSEPGYRDRVKAAMRERIAARTPEEKAKAAANSQKFWSDPEQRKKRSIRQKERFSDPAELQKLRAAMMPIVNDPVRRKKHSEFMKALWADPESRERLLASRAAASIKRRAGPE